MLTIMHSEHILLPAGSNATLRLFDPRQIAYASVLVLALEDMAHPEVRRAAEGWKLPVFFISSPDVRSNDWSFTAGSMTLPLSPGDRHVLETAAQAYEAQALPPFCNALRHFVARQKRTFACPGHQGGRCYDDHPAGARFKQLLGANALQLDVPHAAPELGDVLSHEGPVLQAERLAAQVFGAEKTWFVLNGTSTANKIVTSALLKPGDLVLMDRHNHKSVFLGALIQCAALPVYLEPVRDHDGILGGYLQGTLDETRLRRLAHAQSPSHSIQARPFRLAIIQHATCDGIVIDAPLVIEKIGHLCDYLLFDSAWLGYERFLASLRALSPLGLELHANSPGIFVTQSVHKHMFGLSQASQIHKHDSHLRTQMRYCPTAVMNDAFMQHASTSPSYPILLSLEINAAMLKEGEGERHWQRTAALAQALATQVSTRCTLITPLSAVQPGFAPHFTHEASMESLCFEHGLHHVDPCKAIFLTRPRRGAATQPIPACLITRFLRDRAITPEKTDFYNFTLLLTPSTVLEDIERLLDCLVEFERLYLEGVRLKHVYSSYNDFPPSMHDQSLAECCAQTHDVYASLSLESLQSSVFTSLAHITSPWTPHAAHLGFLRGEARLRSLREAEGHVAAQCIVPYPPGIVCIASGERFSSTVIRYLSAIEALNRDHPWLAQHIQGVHPLITQDGRRRLGVYTLE